MPTTSATTDSNTSKKRAIPTSLLAVLAMCGGFGPFAIDTYVAGLPQIADDLGTTASGTQATLTGFMLALGIMQLVIGPLSDQMGRRRLLLIGTAGAGLASLLCALAPSIEVLIVGRILQGAFGAAGIVLSRAIVADLGKRSGMAHAFSVLVSIQSVAPVIAPMLGGLLIGFAGWRAVFWFLTAGSVLLSAACWKMVPESLPPEDRREGGVRTVTRDFGQLVRTGSYVIPVIAFAASFAVMFSYISASSFVLQGIAGYSQRTYSVLFTINSVMLLVASQVNSRVLNGRTGPGRISFAVASAMAAAVVWLAVAVLVLHTSGWAMALGFFFIVTCQGFLFPNLTTIAMSHAGSRGGAASALMGATQMFVAATIAPMTGIGGGTTALPMLIIMIVGTVVLLAATRVISRHDS